jgi:hypothetical protein
MKFLQRLVKFSHIYNKSLGILKLFGRNYFCHTQAKNICYRNSGLNFSAIYFLLFFVEITISILLNGENKDRLAYIFEK